MSNFDLIITPYFVMLSLIIRDIYLYKSVREKYIAPFILTVFMGLFWIAVHGD